MVRAPLLNALLALSCAAAQAPDPDRVRHLMIDWAGLTHYGSEDAEIRAPKPGENRVVFLGDDITELWGRGDAPFFPGKPYINRGISGQTTPQMLIRFRADVIAGLTVLQSGPRTPHLDQLRVVEFGDSRLNQTFVTLCLIQRNHAAVNIRAPAE